MREKESERHGKERRGLRRAITIRLYSVTCEAVRAAPVIFVFVPQAFIVRCICFSIPDVVQAVI